MSQINYTLTSTQLAEVESGLSKLSPRYDKKAAFEAIYQLYDLLKLEKPRIIYRTSPNEPSSDEGPAFKYPPRPRRLKPWKRALRKAIRSSPASISLEQRIREVIAWRSEFYTPIYGILQNPFLARPLFLAVAACSTDLGLKISEPTRKKIQAWAKVYTTAHLFMQRQHSVYLSAPPTKILTDENGRFHSGEGLAIRYSDKNGLYFWHGVHVPEYLIMEPKKITVRKIHNEMNAELRRVMMERYGLERFLKDAKARLINEGKLGKLYEIRFGWERTDLWFPLDGTDSRDWARMVLVKNSTPEPDGSFKNYVLQVPPHIRRADEAVAWTFGFRDFKTYRNALERET